MFISVYWLFSLFSCRIPSVTISPSTSASWKSPVVSRSLGRAASGTLTPPTTRTTTPAWWDRAWSARLGREGGGIRTRRFRSSSCPVTRVRLGAGQWAGRSCRVPSCRPAPQPPTAGSAWLTLFQPNKQSSTRPVLPSTPATVLPTVRWCMKTSTQT